MQMLSVTEKMNICKNSCTAKNCKNVSILVSMLSKQQPYVLLKRLDIDRPIAKVVRTCIYNFNNFTCFIIGIFKYKTV